MKEKFINQAFYGRSKMLIGKANSILEEYFSQGFTLTLRQLYYQIVTQNLIANTIPEYKNLGEIISKARLAGLIDWKHIEDRTRNLSSFPSWDDAADIVNSAADSFSVDKWADQKFYAEVWVEKEAMAGIVEKACSKFEVPFFCCRGYVSQSEMYYAAKRIISKSRKERIIFHLGDHDPSGLDMTRDIKDRLAMFGANVDIRRIGLNYDQVQKLKLPPNPAKITDSRAGKYIKKFGKRSWELDALKPQYIIDLINGKLKKLINMKKWNKAVKRENEGKESIREAAENL